ncbi:hypothetical protein [Paenibacillus sp. sgz500958]|uniref:hypothetical protein n=1 Tax=Paenibacillus sp. sgz500958 TaxID=3242475 RepID=UPI0036D2FB37
MKHLKRVVALCILIIVLAALASGYGLFSNAGEGEYIYTSIRGETVHISGAGLYADESVSMATQAKAQDGVTLFAGIPLLIAALIMTSKGLVKGRLLLTGTLGYFLYTYASYCFLAMYNSMFLVYAMLFSASFFGFVLCMLSFERDRMDKVFKDTFPAKSTAIYLWVLAFMIAMLWLGKIIKTLIQGSIPVGLEHYSTLTIQALDLAIIVPTAVTAGWMSIRRKSSGYLLGAVIILKGVTLLTAISAMLGAMLYTGTKVSLIELILFPAFNVWIVWWMFVLLKHVREPEADRI